MDTGNYTGEYIGIDGICGLEYGHIYAIQIEKDVYGYALLTSYDASTEENTSLFVRYASTISINKNWNILN